jgi:hypothetical protein
MAQPGVFRWKMSASLAGQEALLKALLERADDRAQRIMLDKIARLIYIEARRLVPRETGELESEIQIFYVGDRPAGVGVSASSPAIAKAWATEYGTWNWSVGSPTGPKTAWEAKTKPEAAMPWLRTGLIVATPRALRYLRRALITGKRGLSLDP